MKQIFILVLIIILFGCAPVSKNIVSVTQADNPITSKGVSFNVPPYGNWKMVRHGSSLSLGMATSQTNSHVVILTYFGSQKKYNSQEDFFNSIRQSWDSNIRDSRYEVDFSKTELKSMLGDFCILVHRKYRDKGAVNKGNNQFLFIEEYGYFFIHPDFPNEVIEALYSERFMTGEQTNIGIENRKAFINSLKLLR